MKQSSFLHGMKCIRALISSEKYREGGWLPPGRELCEHFSLSRMTYRKALECFVQEQAIKSYPRKGHYVFPEFSRPHKVGLAIAAGGDSPLFHSPHALSVIIGDLAKYGFSTQLIQSDHVADIGEKALCRNVSALIWVTPPVAAYPALQQINHDRLIPTVVVNPLCHAHASKDGETVDPPGHFVGIDESYTGQICAEFFAAHSFKKVIYSGRYDYARHSGLITALDQKDIVLGQDDCLNNMAEYPNKKHLRRKLEGYDVLFAEGGLANIANLCGYLQQMDPARRPAILFRHGPIGLCEIYQKFKELNWIGSIRYKPMVARSVSRMIISHLKKGTELQTLKLPASYIDPDVEGYMDELLEIHHCQF